MNPIVWVPFFDGQSNVSKWHPALRKNMEALRAKSKTGLAPEFCDEPTGVGDKVDGWEQKVENLLRLT